MSRIPYRIVELLRKDSLELTDEDRQRLKETVVALDAAAGRDHPRHGHDD